MPARRDGAVPLTLDLPLYRLFCGHLARKGWKNAGNYMLKHPLGTLANPGTFGRIERKREKRW